MTDYANRWNQFLDSWNDISFGPKYGDFDSRIHRNERVEGLYKALSHGASLDYLREWAENMEALQIYYKGLVAEFSDLQRDWPFIEEIHIGVDRAVLDKIYHAFPEVRGDSK